MNGGKIIEHKYNPDGSESMTVKLDIDFKKDEQVCTCDIWKGCTCGIMDAERKKKAEI